MDAACGPLSDGTIEDQERRFVAGEVTQWVLEAGTDSAPPSPEEAVRETLALIIFEAVIGETAPSSSAAPDATRGATGSAT
ncbi:hypothetical protein NRF20_00905 [Streptomyces sp. R-74717]|uniref:hypothetical protein n=1 Tax=Streptomyces TaxID=1883 RepID=UPI0037908BA2